MNGRSESGGAAPRPGPSVEVLISNRQDLPVDEEALAEVARRTLAGEGAGGELSLSVVGPEEMAELHRRYLGEEGPTDVLSFPLGEDGLLGDVVICPRAAGGGRPLEEELRILVAHGVLHLLGYDHEDEKARRTMWARQEAYAGVARPRAGSGRGRPDPREGGPG